MNKAKMSFKSKAQQALSRGEWKKALECFRDHCLKEPGDLRSRLKVAELLERLGQREEAVQMFRKVAEGYATCMRSEKFSIRQQFAGASEANCP